jgi:4-aminobutyrate aminotransferase-like enzyme
VSCAAALASIAVIEEEGLVARAEQMGTRMLDQLRTMQGAAVVSAMCAAAGDGRDRARR